MSRSRIWLRKLLMIAGLVFALAFAFNSQAEAADNYKTVKVKASKIEKDGADKAIQAALDKAKESATSKKPYKVVVPKGSYTLTKGLHIYSNTWLYADGVTFKQSKKSTGNMLRVGESNDKKKGYYYKNITIEGAVFNENKQSVTVLKIAHASNVTVKNCTFKNSVDAHLAEIGGVKNITFENCKFKNQTIKAKKDSLKRHEALQIDILEDYHFPGYKPQDLANKNITINKCTFTNVPRGIGSHTAILNNPTDGVTITNCKFTDCTSVGIQGMNWINVNIKNNTITGTPRGIAMYTFQKHGVYLAKTLKKQGGVKATVSSKYKALKEDQKITISGNSITTKGKDPDTDYVSTGIMISGMKLTKAYKNNNLKDGTGATVPKGDYSISGVTVKNNTIKTKGHGILLEYAKNTTIESNKITYNGSASSKTAYYGIRLKNHSTGNTVTGNTVSSKRSNGIYLTEHSKAKVTDNKITAAGKDGIRVDNSSTASSIKNNTISGTKANGIFLYNSGKATTISGNTISSAKGSGISLNKNASVTDIKNNTIKSASTNGIYVYDNSTVTNISSNTISSAGKYGIGEDKSSTVTTIDNNTISSPKSNGIYVVKSKVSTVDSNKITSPGKYGMSVDNKSTATTIKGNTITGAKNHGLIIRESSKVKTIKSNTIKTCTERGITVNSIKCDLTISGNTISGNKTDAQICLNPGSASYTITVTDNTITGTSGTYGIWAINTGKASISGNTVSSAKEAIKVSSSFKATVGDNNL